MMCFKRVPLFVGLIGLVILAGCDQLPGGERDKLQDQLRDRIDAKQQLWKEQNIDDYEFIYRQQVGDELIDSVTVFVSQGAVDSIQTSSSFPTEDVVVKEIDSFFQFIRDRIDDDNIDSWSVDFNDDLGYPARYEAFVIDGSRERIGVLDFRQKE